MLNCPLFNLANLKFCLEQSNSLDKMKLNILCSETDSLQMHNVSFKMLLSKLNFSDSLEVVGFY